MCCCCVRFFDSINVIVFSSRFIRLIYLFLTFFFIKKSCWYRKLSGVLFFKIWFYNANIIQISGRFPMHGVSFLMIIESILKSAPQTSNVSVYEYKNQIGCRVTALVVQWLERRHKDLMIYDLYVADSNPTVGRGCWSFEWVNIYKLRSRVAARVTRKRTLAAKSHKC
jgi:hypothetical protein